jgi:arsenate reductase-like glutaredoxin family protein
MKTNPLPRRGDQTDVEHPNLIRRPILVQGSKIALGFDEEQFRELSGR